MVLTGDRRTHLVEVSGRGTLPVTDWSGPPGAPVLVLLHGVTIDADTNWSAVCPALARRYRVITLDLRGHGRGLPVRGRYRLEDCADDVAAVVRALDTGPAVAVGYSMGGMVAQLFWRRHRDLTAGLVLCSTSRNVTGTWWPLAVSTTRLLAPLFPIGADAIAAPLLDAEPDPQARRPALNQMRRTPLATALDAMHAVSRFSSHEWIGGVDVPTAVLVTRDDRVVPPHRQHRLAAAVPGATTVEVDGDHGVFLAAPAAFADGLLRACAAVTATGPKADTAA